MDDMFVLNTVFLGQGSVFVSSAFIVHMESVLIDNVWGPISNGRLGGNVTFVNGADIRETFTLSYICQRFGPELAWQES